MDWEKGEMRGWEEGSRDEIGGREVEGSSVVGTVSEVKAVRSRSVSSLSCRTSGTTAVSSLTSSPSSFFSTWTVLSLARTTNCVFSSNCHLVLLPILPVNSHSSPSSAAASLASTLASFCAELCGDVLLNRLAKRLSESESWALSAECEGRRSRRAEAAEGTKGGRGTGSSSTLIHVVPALNLQIFHDSIVVSLPYGLLGTGEEGMEVGSKGEGRSPKIWRARRRRTDDCVR